MQKNTKYRICVPVMLFLLLAGSTMAQAQGLGSLVKQLQDKAKSASSSSSSSASIAGLSNDDIASGLKEALQKGVTEGVKQLSAVNGYFSDPLVKILFPPEAQKIESTLRGLGMGSLCDKVILSLNRAAEQAAGKAAPVFVDAIKKMTLQDASSILLGSDTAATAYFEKSTTPELTARFKPVIDSSLQSVGATNYWSQVMTEYNKIPLVKKINPDLGAYATQKAIEGLFVKVAAEEKKIRSQAGARTTPLLQKVFGYAQQAKK